MVNNLHATDSNISPGLICKVHCIYISVPWFWFTHMDLALRLLFHRFQIIFHRIRLTFSVAIGTIKINKWIKYSPVITAVSTVNIPKPKPSCSWTYKINKLLVSLNECFNNIIHERTIEYNTTQPPNSTAKQSNATCEIKAHGKTKVHMTYSRAHMFVTSYQMFQLWYQSLLAVNIVDNYSVT